MTLLQEYSHDCSDDEGRRERKSRGRARLNRSGSGAGSPRLCHFSAHDVALNSSVGVSDVVGGRNIEEASIVLEGARGETSVGTGVKSQLDFSRVALAHDSGFVDARASRASKNANTGGLADERSGHGNTENDGFINFADLESQVKGVDVGVVAGDVEAVAERVGRVERRVDNVGEIVEFDGGGVAVALVGQRDGPDGGGIVGTVQEASISGDGKILILNERDDGIVAASDTHVVEGENVGVTKGTANQCFDIVRVNWIGTSQGSRRHINALLGQESSLTVIRLIAGDDLGVRIDRLPVIS